MASFTDNIPQFNPYIKQLPIEAMVQVGMEKQRRYDEGLQKIQTNIDTVAGLPVGNDADKAYLQSSLNALGSKLKTVAAGDFSNYQLVNSVGGMTKQIIKDPIIQTAVKSAANIKKQTEEMEKAISEGKSSQSNIWDFNSKASKWLNATKAGEAFNGRYTPHVDVEKKWMEVVKGLHSDLVEQDIPYERNADGSINYNKTAAAMQRISKETISSAKIENALRATLSPDELNQLSIDGRYQFREYDTPDKLAVYSKTKFNSQIDLNNSKIKELEGVIGLSTSNPDMQKNAEDIIKSLQNRNKQLQNDLSEELELVKADPDQAKSIIYKNGAIAQFANTFAWENNKENVLANPVLDNEHWEKTYAITRANQALAVRSQNWKEYADKKDWDFKQKDIDLKTKKQMIELYGTSAPFETYKGQDTNIKDPLTAMLQDETMYNDSANSGIAEMVKGIPGTTPAQIRSAIDKYKNGDANWYVLGNGNTKKAIPVQWRDHVDAIIENENKATRLTAARTRIEKEVDAQFKPDEQKIINSVKGLKGIVLKDKSGRDINFTPEEIVKFISKEASTQTSVPTYGGLGYGTSQTRYTRDLTEKEKLLTAGLNGDNVESWSRIYSTVKPMFKNVSSKKEDAVQSEILKRNGNYVPRITTITFSSEGGDVARRGWENITDAVLSRYSGEGGAKELSKSDITKGKEWVSGDGREKIIYKKLVQGDKTYVVLSKGGEEITIPLERSEARQLPITDPNEPNEAYKDVVNAQYLGDGNTNPTGRYRDSYFGKPQMPNAGLDIKADLSWNKSNTAKQYIQLKLNTPSGIIPLQLDNNPLSREQAIPFLQQLTKSQIKQLYLNSPLINKRYKEIIKNL